MGPTTAVCDSQSVSEYPIFRSIQCFITNLYTLEIASETSLPDYDGQTTGDDHDSAEDDKLAETAVVLDGGGFITAK